MQATASVSRDNERRVLGAQMAKLGVRLVNKYGRILQCAICEATWHPQPNVDGSFFGVSGDARIGAIGEAIFWRNSGEHREIPKTNHGTNRSR